MPRLALYEPAEPALQRMRPFLSLGRQTLRDLCGAPASRCDRCASPMRRGDSISRSNDWSQDANLT